MKRASGKKVGGNLISISMLILFSLLCFEGAGAHGGHIAASTAKLDGERMERELSPSQSLDQFVSMMSRAQKEQWNILQEADRLAITGHAAEALLMCGGVVRAIANKAGVGDGRDSQAILNSEAKGRVDQLDLVVLLTALNERANINYVLKANEDAEADYQAIIAISRGRGAPEGSLAMFRIELCRVWTAMKGRDGDVVKETTAIINSNPDKKYIARAYVFRSLATSDREGAMADLERAIATDEDCLEAYQVRMINNEFNGKIEAVIADLDQIIRLAPEDTQSKSNRAFWWAKLLERAKAETRISSDSELNEVMRLSVSAADHELKGDMPAAIIDLTNALALSPGYTSLLSRRAGIYRKMGEYDKAIADYDSVIKAAPEWQRKVQDLREQLGLSKSNSALSAAIYQRGLTKLDKGDYNGALHDLGSTFSHNEEWSYERHEARVKALMGLGNLDYACVYLSQAIDSAPGEYALGKTNAHKLSRLYFQRGECFRDTPTKERDVQRALQDFSKAIELNPQNIEALLSRAWHFRNTEEWQKGIDDASRVLELDPKNVNALACLGINYYGMSDIPSAIKSFELALAIQPDDDFVLNALAWLLATEPVAQHRDGRRAVQYAEKAVELTKGKVHYYLDTLAAAYAEAGRFKEAVATQGKAIALEAQDPKRDPSISADYEARLNLYRQGKPYRR